MFGRKRTPKPQVSPDFGLYEAQRAACIMVGRGYQGTLSEALALVVTMLPEANQELVAAEYAAKYPYSSLTF